MSSTVKRPMNVVSDLFFAIGDAIDAAGLGVDVANYDEFDGTVGDACVLIEFERTSPGERQNDGRYVHVMNITLHAVVGRFRKYHALEAVNLATALERLADLNRWGFSGRQCDLPEDMHSGPSIFQKGSDGYDSWCVSFRQGIAPGPAKTPEDPVINGAPLVAWRVTDEGLPVDFSDLASYAPLEVPNV